jgi:hypothetical protein
VISTGLTPSTSVVTDSAMYRIESRVMSPADKTASITRVSYLEQEVFDEGGHIRRGLDRDSVEHTVAAINDLRRSLGWLEINLDGRWRWPS